MWKTLENKSHGKVNFNLFSFLPVLKHITSLYCFHCEATQDQDWQLIFGKLTFVQCYNNIYSFRNKIAYSTISYGFEWISVFINLFVINLFYQKQKIRTGWIHHLPKIPKSIRSEPVLNVTDWVVLIAFDFPWHFSGTRSILLRAVVYHHMLLVAYLIAALSVSDENIDGSVKGTLEIWSRTVRFQSKNLIH